MLERYVFLGHFGKICIQTGPRTAGDGRAVSWTLGRPLWPLGYYEKYFAFALQMSAGGGRARAQNFIPQKFYTCLIKNESRPGLLIKNENRVLYLLVPA